MQVRPWVTRLAWAYLALVVLGFGVGVHRLVHAPVGGYQLADGGDAWVVQEVRPGSPAARAGLGEGDRVLEVRDGRGLTARPGQEERRLSQRIAARAGDVFLLRVARAGAEPEALAVRLEASDPATFRPSDWITWVGTMLVALLYLGVGAALMLVRPSDAGSLLLGGFLISCVALGAPHPGVADGLRELLLLAGITRQSVLFTSLVFFALVFPEPLLGPRFRRWAVGGLLVLFLPHFANAARLYVGLAYGREAWLDVAWMGGLGDLYGLGYTAAYILATVAFLWLQYRRAAHEDSRRRLRVVGLGFAGTFALLFLVLGSLYLVTDTARFQAILSSAGFRVGLPLLLSLFPLAVAYAVVKHRMFGVRVILRSGLRYALARRVLLSLLAVPLLALTYQIGRKGAVEIFSAESWRLAPVVLLLLAVTLYRERILASLDRRFFREAYDARRVLSRMADRMRVAATPESLEAALREGVERALHPARVSLARTRAGSMLPEDSAPAIPSALEARLEETDDALRVHDGRTGVGRRALPDGSVRFLRAHDAELVVPLRGRSAELLGALILGPRRSGEPYSGEDAELLQAAGSQFVAALENLQLSEEVRRRKEAESRLRQEIELARDVQRRLLPVAPPRIPGVDLAGLCVPARIVGGDYFDFIPLGRGRVGLAVADVSGKGLAAAMVMSNLQAGLRAALGAGVGIAEAMDAVNRLLFDLTADNRFASFFFTLLDPAERRLHYINAGHNAPILIRRGSDRIETLPPTAPILGVLDTWRSDVRSVPIGDGDLLIAYTDGLCEIRDERGREFADGELERAAWEAGRDAGDAEGVARRLLDEARRLRPEGDYEDDLTIAVARFTL